MYIVAPEGISSAESPRHICKSGEVTIGLVEKTMSKVRTESQPDIDVNVST